jgi:hypothetical protein
MQFSSQQDILPGHGSPSHCHHGLVSHPRPTAQRHQRSSLQPLCAISVTAG